VEDVVRCSLIRVYKGVAELAVVVVV
jgi:hypothetical protein